ncbi:MAG TPA: DUF3127 domain-containing protein [Edaphocola sp.]|nr:DUF3127 domain-containing protein [Edaphocola sp.]
MALEVIGKLIEIFPTQQIKENFSKREFVIEMASTTNTGMTYVNLASFQLVNNNCAAIEKFQIGEEVKVSFDIRGNKWEKDGQVRYITNLNAWRIEPAMQQPEYGPAQQAQQPFGPSGNTSNPTPPQAAPPSFEQPGSPAQDDDLPF